MDEDGGEAELLSGMLSLSLTEAHGDPKVCTIGGFKHRYT